MATMGRWSLPSLAVATAPVHVASALHELPPLGYAADAVEPVVDARTMTTHHRNHHGARGACLARAPG